MKRLIYTLSVMLLFSAVSVSAQNKSETDKVSTITENREVGSFSSIDITGRFSVVLYTNEKPEVSVTAAERYVTDVVTVVENGTLKVNMANLIGDENVSIIDGVKTKYNDYLLRKPIEIRIGVKELNIVNLAGFTNLVMKESLHKDKFYISMGDASKAYFNLQVRESLDVHLVGAAKLDLEGKTDKFVVNVHGASALTAPKMNAANTIVQLTGAARAEIHTTESLEADLKGATKLVCTGSPKSVKQNSSMGSSISVK